MVEQNPKPKTARPKFTKEPGTRERLMRMEQELEDGFRFLETFDEVRVVTIYGSAQAKPEMPWYTSAYDLGKKLASDDDPMAVVTGGGPGIMEAANKGAYEAGGISIGLGIQLDNIAEEPNPYTTHRMDFYYFFARKLILAHIAQAYVYFPGGFGTMDEFFKLATLITTKKMERVPIIVLVGKEYWENLFSWLRNVASKKFKTLSEEDLKIFHITDDIEEAYRFMDTVPRRINLSDVV